MNFSNNPINHIFRFVALAFFLSCAAVMSPPGGPKDITPPDLIETFPLDGTVVPATAKLLTTNALIKVKKNVFKNMFVHPPFWLSKVNNFIKNS